MKKAKVETPKMEKPKQPSRRRFMTTGAIAATGAAAVAGGFARTGVAEAAEVKSNIPRSKMNKLQLQQDNEARKAAAILQKLDPDIQIEWVEAAKLPKGTRRIIQIKG